MGCPKVKKLSELQGVTVMAYNEHLGSRALRHHSLDYLEPTEPGSHASTQLQHPLACDQGEGMFG